MILRPDNLDRVGPMLQTKRKMRGLSLREMEARTGLLNASISNIELNKNGARVSSLVLIADALGLEVEIREKQK